MADAVLARKSKRAYSRVRIPQMPFINTLSPRAERTQSDVQKEHSVACTV